MRTAARRVTAAVTSALAGAVLAVTAVAAPASASVADCANGANGFVSIPHNQWGPTYANVELGQGTQPRVNVTLRVATVQGQSAPFAKIESHYGSTRRGDQVWLNWWTPARETQCGPWTVQSNGAPNTSAARPISPWSSTDWYFQACGRLTGGETGCTLWMWLG